MAQPARQRDAILRQLICPIRKTEHPLCRRTEMHAAEERIVAQIHMTVMGVTLAVIQRRAGLDMLNRLVKPASVEARRSDGMMRL